AAAVAAAAVERRVDGDEGALRRALGTRAARDDLAPRLVAGDERVARRRQAVLEEVAVGAADAPSADGADHLVGAPRTLTAPTRSLPPPERPSAAEREAGPGDAPRPPGGQDAARVAALSRPPDPPRRRHLRQRADHLVADDPLRLLGQEHAGAERVDGDAPA